MTRLVYTRVGPAHAHTPPLLSGIGELCWWECPHGHRLVAPAEWVRHLHCGASYVNAAGHEQGHQFHDRGVMVGSVPLLPQVEVWTEEASGDRAGTAT